MDPARHAGRRPEPAYAGVGFIPGTSRAWFAEAARRHDTAGIRATLHRTPVHPGEVYVAHAGVPHYLGPRISFIEVQEPSDHIVIPETSGADDDGATMGLGWDLALDMIDYTAAGRAETLARARQQPRVLRTSHDSREVRLFSGDVLPFFDATALEVPGEIEVSDGRFSIAVVAAGDGWVEGDFGSEPIRRGQTFALPASLPVRDPGRPRTGPGDPLPRPRRAMTPASPAGLGLVQGPAIPALADRGWPASGWHRSRSAGAARRPGLPGRPDRRAARSGIRPVNEA